MTMKDLNVEKTQRLLSRIMEFELAGVVRYTHYSLMVAGPNRIPIVAFMKGQANESLLHAQQAGEILTGLGGHPTQQIAPIDESHQHSVQAILEESLAHERRALRLYKELLDVVENRSVYLEEFARTQIAQEELHGLELRKMLRDIGVAEPRPGAHDVFQSDEPSRRDDEDKAKDLERRAQKHAQKDKKDDKRDKKDKKDKKDTKSGRDDDAFERMKRELAEVGGAKAKDDAKSSTKGAQKSGKNGGQTGAKKRASAKSKKPR